MDLFTGDAAGLAVLVGFAAPYLIALVNQPRFSRRTRQIVAVVISALLGAGIAYQAGTFHDGWTIAAAGATVLATSQAVYKRLFGSSVRTVEYLTSGRRPPRADPDPEPEPELVDDVPGRHSAGR